MNSSLIHFENLWSMGEEVSNTQFKDTPDVLSKLSETIDDLQAVHRIGNQNNGPHSLLGIDLKKKMVGKLLFILTALSHKENIDVYAALKSELEMMRLKEKLEEIKIDEMLEPVEQSV